MRSILYFFSFLVLLGCSEPTITSQHSETKDHLRFSFKAVADRWNKNEISVDIKATFTNTGNDTLCFYEGICSYWIDPNPVNLHPYLTGIQCLDTLPDIIRIAPKKSIIHNFRYYAENETDLLFNTSFGVTCYPVKKDFQLSSESAIAYLKNRKSITFKPANVRI